MVVQSHHKFITKMIIFDNLTILINFVKFYLTKLRYNKKDQKELKMHVNGLECLVYGNRD